MIKSLRVSASVLAVCLAFSVTPAFAAVDPVYGTDPVLDQACSDIQKANDASGFMSFADNIQLIPGTPVTVDDGIVSEVGFGAASTVYSNFANAHVNGQSVNIHAYGDKTVTYQGRTVTYRTKTTRIDTRTAQCHVHKETSGANQEEIHPGYQIAPNGQQTDEPVSTTVEVVEYGVRTETIMGPWIDPNASATGVQVVICISPGRVPGTWRNQNGYTGSLGTCSRAWYDTLGSTPSVSLPSS